MHLYVQWKLNINDDNILMFGKKFTIQKISMEEDKNIEYNCVDEKNCLTQVEITNNLNLDIVYNTKINMGNSKPKSLIYYLVIQKINPITMNKIIKIFFCFSIPTFNKLLTNEIVNTFNVEPERVGVNYCKLKDVRCLEQEDNSGNKVIMKGFNENHPNLFIQEFNHQN